MNIFDGLASNVFGTVANTMGYDAIWQPVDGSDSQTARVLFKDPSVAQKVGPIEFRPNEFVMEYKLGDLVGLKESTDSRCREEVMIDDRSYMVVAVDAISDGKTFRAILEPTT